MKQSKIALHFLYTQHLKNNKDTKPHYTSTDNPPYSEHEAIEDCSAFHIYSFERAAFATAPFTHVLSQSIAL
ncbi:hypothetical protein [Fusibacter sp. JL216-2]|uniref:hypothetical protein n=1 Tax=Fusibacter sp. JL216-2 TaxID=3071453 RepID=UPI003D344DA6